MKPSSASPVASEQHSAGAGRAGKGDEDVGSDGVAVEGWAHGGPPKKTGLGNMSALCNCGAADVSS